MPVVFRSLFPVTRTCISRWRHGEDQVDFINERKLAELPGDEFVAHGRIEGDFPESSLPTQLNLSIKEQAQVIFIDNDYERRWVNGTIGIISGIDERGNVFVLLEDGREFLVEPVSWRNYRYKYNEKENGWRKR